MCKSYNFIGFHQVSYMLICMVLVQGERYMEGVKFKPQAIEVLRGALEFFLVEVFEQANLFALHAGRVTILPKDIQMVKVMQRRPHFSLSDFDLPSTMSKN